MSKNHYLKHTKIYSVWNEMRNRCNNPNDKSYNRYGGKGISVCKEWDDFRVFYPWAIENGYKEGLTLDRIDPTGNYEPNNCRWVDMTTQQRNRSNNVKLEHNGEKLTINEWCEKLNFPITTAKSRYYRALKKNGTANFYDVFSRVPNYQNRKIAQYSKDGTLIRVWDKLCQISSETNMDYRNVYSCCIGKLDHAYGYTWKYADSESDYVFIRDPYTEYR